MKYKVIKAVPNYKVNDVFDTKDVSWNPSLYPELFEKLNIINRFITEDGVEISSFDKCYYVSDQYKVVDLIYQDYVYKHKIFAYYEKALEYIISCINITTEDGNITGEFIPVYAVCVKSEWEIKNWQSLALFQRMSATSPLSDNWKYFKDVDERTDYIYLNKPIYSFTDIATGNHPEYIKL